MPVILLSNNNQDEQMFTFMSVCQHWNMFDDSLSYTSRNFCFQSQVKLSRSLSTKTDGN